MALTLYLLSGALASFDCRTLCSDTHIHYLIQAFLQTKKEQAVRPQEEFPRGTAVKHETLTFPERTFAGKGKRVEPPHFSTLIQPVTLQFSATAQENSSSQRSNPLFFPVYYPTQHNQATLRYTPSSVALLQEEKKYPQAAGPSPSISVIAAPIPPMVRFSDPFSALLMHGEEISVDKKNSQNHTVTPFAKLAVAHATIETQTEALPTPPLGPVAVAVGAPPPPPPLMPTMVPPPPPPPLPAQPKNRQAQASTQESLIESLRKAVAAAPETAGLSIEERIKAQQQKPPTNPVVNIRIKQKESLSDKVEKFKTPELITEATSLCEKFRQTIAYIDKEQIPREQKNAKKEQARKAYQEAQKPLKSTLSTAMVNALIKEAEEETKKIMVELDRRTAAAEGPNQKDIRKQVEDERSSLNQQFLAKKKKIKLFQSEIENASLSELFSNLQQQSAITQKNSSSPSAPSEVLDLNEVRANLRKAGCRQGPITPPASPPAKGFQQKTPKKILSKEQGDLFQETAGSPDFTSLTRRKIRPHTPVSATNSERSGTRQKNNALLNSSRERVVDPQGGVASLLSPQGAGQTASASLKPEEQLQAPAPGGANSPHRPPAFVKTDKDQSPSRCLPSAGGGTKKEEEKSTLFRTHSLPSLPATEGDPSKGVTRLSAHLQQTAAGHSSGASVPAQKRKGSFFSFATGEWAREFVNILDKIPLPFHSFPPSSTSSRSAPVSPATRDDDEKPFFSFK